MDLTEVEAVLCGHPGVAAAAARVWEAPSGLRLAAYVEAAPVDGRQHGRDAAAQLQVCNGTCYAYNRTREDTIASTPHRSHGTFTCSGAQ